jgi:PAS domain S-box-containing protein
MSGKHLIKIKKHANLTRLAEIQQGPFSWVPESTKMTRVDSLSPTLKTDTVSHDTLGWLLRASHDPMLVTDAAGMIVQANERLCALLGWPMEELLGEPVELLVPPTARSRHAAMRQTSSGAARPVGASRLSAATMSGAGIPVEISL